MNFSEIIGQDDAKELLSSSIKNKRCSHAYILSGEEGSGKMMLAKRFAAALLCEQQNGDACGTCKSCIQAESDNNPDIVYVRHEKPNTISVDEIRHQINDDVIIKPYSSPYKVYIVDDADLMNQQAQNALLKTIEEPPEYVVMLLLTVNSLSFLQTILSRCVKIEMKPIRGELIRRELQDNYHCMNHQARMIEAFAQGNLGKAITLVSSEEFNEVKNRMITLTKNAGNNRVSDVDEMVKTLAGDKAHINDYLDLMTIWFKDVLLYKATASQDNLVFIEEAQIIASQAEEYSYEQLDNIIQEIKTARLRIKSNVNYELTVELLLMTMSKEPS